jgi:hypothetical protein
MKYLSLLLILFAGSACAESTEVLIQQLTAAVRTELNDPQAQKDSDFNRKEQLLRCLVDIKVNSVEGKPRTGYADYYLSSIEHLGGTSSSKTTQELCQALGKQVRSEIAERQTALVESSKKKMSEAIRSALAARTSRDFDGPMDIARNALPDGDIVNSKDPTHKALVQAIQNTTNFFRHLQDYVVGLGHESFAISENRWKNIFALQNDFSVFMPRSEVLSGLEEFHKRVLPPEGSRPMTQEEYERKGWELVSTAKSLDDLERVNTQFAALTHSDEAAGLSMKSLTLAMSILREYARTYSTVKRGEISQSDIRSLVLREPELHNDVFANLRNQLLLAGVSHLLQASDKPKDGEMPPAYLNRITERAVASGDWDLLVRAIELMPTVNPDSRHPLADRLATRNFLAGLNQERGRQYALAVGSYQKAMNAGSSSIKVELIEQRLEKIRKDHPDAFPQTPSESSQASDKNGAASGTRLFPGVGGWPIAPYRLNEPLRSPAKP